VSDTTNLPMLPSTRAAGQATMVEQQRAVAEVQGAILVAQNVPRDEIQAKLAMLDSCGQPHLAERAFFRFPRGGQQVSGPSVHLARELARCWGNIQYGVKEMRRDDEVGESEMLAFAWDVQTNTRTETTFIVPHKRDKRGGPERLTDMRDIYENNANAGARRVRECIFAVLPPWFTEQAKEACLQTNVDGGGKPLVDRVSEALERFAGVKVTRDQLERKVGRKVGVWTAQDVAVLVPVYRSIVSGEATREQEFPPEQVSVADLPDPPSVVAQEDHAAKSPEPVAAEQEPDPSADTEWPEVHHPGHRTHTPKPDPT
jgi:hypothetical protein